MRDRIALAIVVGGVVLALPIWFAGAGWVGAGVVLLAVVAAAVSYRVETPTAADDPATGHQPS